jgi:glutamine amidotransferase-like uncharacterized protein
MLFSAAALLVASLIATSNNPAWAEQPQSPPNCSSASASAGAALAPLPAAQQAIRVAIYQGEGSFNKGIRNVERCVKLLPGVTIERLSADEIRQGALGPFDVVVFSGGAASAQARSIGDEGRAEVRRFVEDGGGYLGVCAGAYLACAGYDWGVELISARALSDKWQRGTAVVDIELTPEGRQVFGRCDGPLPVKYENGPVFGPLERNDLPSFRTLASYATEVAENDTPAGIMIGSPAIAEAAYGAGRVIIMSPHPEDSAGLHRMVPLAILRLSAGADAE